MAGTDNLIEIVDELREFMAQQRRIMFGDEQARQPGVIAQMDGMRHDMRALDGKIEELVCAGKKRKPSMPLLLAGLLAFLASGAFAQVTLDSWPELRAALTMPWPVAASLAIVFLGAAVLAWLYGSGQLWRG